GATQYAQCHVQTPATSAGPNDRAGFIEAPVIGPVARMSIATVRPIPNPPILTVFPRSSTAVPNTDVTSRKVVTNSTTRSVPAPSPPAPPTDPVVHKIAAMPAKHR